MYNTYIEEKITGTWKEKHKEVIESLLLYINSHSDKFVLKGGTSLMECYGLTRFSEDIDLDSTGKNNIHAIIDSFCRREGYTFRIAKDTDTVTRFMIDYGGENEHGDKPLKVEISHRRREIPASEMTVINNIRVYTLDQIALMKSQAYMSRDKIRDLYDVTYIINNKFDELNPFVVNALQNALGEKGIEQFDYITAEQSDELIDNNELGDLFLNAYDKVGLITHDVPQKEIKPTITEQMEYIWDIYFHDTPKEDRHGLTWNGENLRPAIFEDMYLAECEKAGITPKQEIKEHFWDNCVSLQEYQPKFIKHNDLNKDIGD